MTARLTFKVAFRADMHLGAGHGLGEGVDSALLRDADGVPRLSGTELAGTLRATARQLVEALVTLDPELARRLRRCRLSGDAAERARPFCPATDPPAGRCPICRV